MNRYILYSLTVHLVILALFAGAIPKGCGATGLPGTDKGSSEMKNEGTIVPKKETIQVELEEPKEGIETDKAKPIPKQEKYVDRDCSGHKWFGGIGVSVIGNFSGQVRVEKVYDGYPANKNGVLAGDIILNYPVMGEPGSEVVVQIYRNNALLDIPMIREKICIEDAK